MKTRFYLFTLTVLLLLVEACPVLSQDISFNKVTLPDENVRGLITGITQDLQGNIWFSTAGSGLCRFDGIHLQTFSQNFSDPGTLTATVECVYADKSGIIWAGNYGTGLEKFDPKTNHFTYYKHNEQDTSSISNDTITCLLQDHEGVLWIGTESTGLNRMDIKTGKFTHYRHSENNPNSLSYDQIRVIYEDKKGVLWVGTGSPFNTNPDKKGGLNRFNKNTGVFTRYLHDDKNLHSLIDNRIRAIFEDSYGNFWIGTADDGLHLMNRQNGTFERLTYDPAHPGKLSRPSLKILFPWVDDHITFITEDARKAIWIGTFANGITRYDPATKKLTHYARQKDSTGNFSDSTTWWEFTSRDGVMWMSTWSGGLYKFDPAHQNITHTALNFTYGLSCFANESSHIQWLGGGSGLIRVDTKNNNTQQFVHDPKKTGSISSNSITWIYKDRENRIWAATDGGGLNLFNPDKQSFTVYKHDPKIRSSLAHDVINSLYEDEQSNLWVSTALGLDRMNIEKGEFTHFKPFPDDTIPFGKNFVYWMLEDSKRNLWIGNCGEGGLHVLNRKTGQFKSYLPLHNVFTICEDSYGKIWAGTFEGLYSYNSSVDSFSLFIDPSTGNSISVVSVIEGNDKNLWVASPSDIYKINTKLNEVFRLGKNFGINITNSGGAFKATDGKLIFPNKEGYYSFYPDKLSSNTKPPEIVLTDLRIRDHFVNPGSGSPLKEDLLQAKQIELNHDQNVFSFLFNVVHYSNPDANISMYMLENYDKSWRPAGSERTAYYYNIPPGHYTFRIKATSSEGVWAEKSIEVIISPPWWRTWWAYTLYAICFLSIAFFTNRIVRNRIIEKERMKNKEKELAQAKEIEKAYTELKATQAQLIQSEKMASLGELTAGIAHEIQNPLNFVNNFSEVNNEMLEELKAEHLKPNAERNEQTEEDIINDVIANNEKINHHGKRADAIVKGMLQHSRQTKGTKELININALCDEYLRLSYHGLRAKDKNFNAVPMTIGIKTDFDESIGKINIVPQDIGRVLLNLYNNAFYATNEKQKAESLTQNAEYKPLVSVQTRKLNSKVEIIVIDNGNGIPQNTVDKIFQPFFTTKPTGQGTGLGLSLSYDIIKAHGGEIKVEMNEGGGAEFIIQLPIV